MGKSLIVFKLLLINLCLHLLLACSPISDDEFFEPEKTDTYLLEKYNGETGFDLGSNFNILPSQVNEINLESNDGKSITNISGIFLGNINQINTKTVIVYCHDKSKNIDYYWPRLQILAQLDLNDFGIFAVDYRGYGKSEGTPSESGFYADVNAALVWLEDQGLTGDRLIMYGYGIGSAVAIELTSNPRSLTPAKLIIESPLASIESLIQDTTLQSTPSAFLTELKFDNVSKMRHITQPLMWLHGSADKVYDIENQGELLFNQHTGTETVDKFAHRIDGASHENVPLLFANGTSGYVFEILSFINL